MILPHAHDPAAPAVNNGISVAETALCGQPFRRATRPLTVELLVFVIRKIHHAIGHGEGAAPVLVHARAGTKWGRGDVRDRPAGRPAHHQAASVAYSWPHCPAASTSTSSTRSRPSTSFFVRPPSPRTRPDVFSTTG